MTRISLDTTHNGLPFAMERIKQLPNGSIVQLYDTGSPGIIATAEDINSVRTLPNIAHVVMIDQGFTGSPNMNAVVRDCENGAWTVQNAVDKKGWNVARPTLYLGFPDNAQQAFDLGWRGDVILVMAQDMAPSAPPLVPNGINVIAIQWNFKNPNWDEEVVFDDFWPEAKVTVPNNDPTPDTDTPKITDQTGWKWCNKCGALFYSLGKSVCPVGGEHDGSQSGEYVLESIVVN